MRDHISVCLNALRDNFLLSCEGPCVAHHTSSERRLNNIVNTGEAAQMCSYTPEAFFPPLTQVFCEYTKMSQKAFLFFFLLLFAGFAWRLVSACACVVGLRLFFFKRAVCVCLLDQRLQALLSLLKSRKSGTSKSGLSSFQHVWTVKPFITLILFCFWIAAIRTVRLFLIRCVYPNHLFTCGRKYIYFYSSFLQPKKVYYKGHLMLVLISQGY